MAYLVAGVNGGEGALEAAHVVAAGRGLAEAAAQEVVVAILDRGRPVVFRSKLVRVVAQERALAREEVVRVVCVANEVEVCCIATRLGLAWGLCIQYGMRSSFGGAVAELTSINLVERGKAVGHCACAGCGGCSGEGRRWDWAAIVLLPGVVMLGGVGVGEHRHHGQPAAAPGAWLGRRAQPH